MRLELLKRETIVIERWRCGSFDFTLRRLPVLSVDFASPADDGIYMQTIRRAFSGDSVSPFARRVRFQTTVLNVGGVMEMEPAILTCGCKIGREKVRAFAAQMADADLAPWVVGDLITACALATRNPEEQQRQPIVCLGSAAKQDGATVVPLLTVILDQRYLCEAHGDDPMSGLDGYPAGHGFLLMRPVKK